MSRVIAARFSSVALLLLMSLPCNSSASDDTKTLILPPAVSCGAGWKIEGKPSLYNRDTLSDRINGEAELYMPYGFDGMAATRYSSEKNAARGMDAEIYRMGSPMDAFGMYANYRQKEGSSVDAGAESNLSGSQLFFYQGRYFVHIQMTGAGPDDLKSIKECAKAVSSLIPAERKRPPELSVFDRAEIVKGSERYLPQSLLGYDFLNMGFMADAVADGSALQIFILLSATQETVSTAFERYRAVLTQTKNDPADKNGATILEGVDPMYGPVILLKKGACLAGALKFSDKKGARLLLEKVCS